MEAISIARGSGHEVTAGDYMHYTRYFSADCRPTTPNTDPQEEKHVRITFVPWICFCLRDFTLQGGALVFANTLCCQVLETGRQSASLEQDPGPEVSHPALHR